MMSQLKLSSILVVSFISAPSKQKEHSNIGFQIQTDTEKGRSNKTINVCNMLARITLEDEEISRHGRSTRSDVIFSNILFKFKRNFRAKSFENVGQCTTRRLPH